MPGINPKASLRLSGGTINQQDYATRMREGLTRDDSIRVLKELQAQLRTPNGVKGGILRLMNASDRQSNAGKTMIFERKNWLQGGRYFSGEGRQRTAEALKILFRNAGLSTRDLERHLQENSNKAGGKAFMSILNRAVEAVDLVKGSEFDIDKTAREASQLSAEIDTTRKRGDLEDLIPRFNALERNLTRYLEYLELPPEDGQERTVFQTPPVLAARAQIAVAKAKLTALQEAAAVSKGEVTRASGLIEQAQATVEICRARFEARDPASPIFDELSRLRTEIGDQFTRSLNATQMADDKDQLQRARAALHSGIDQLTQQIKNEYSAYKRDPASDWGRYSDETRAAVQSRLIGLAQQVDRVRAEQRTVLLQMAEPERAEGDREADRNRLESLTKQLNAIKLEASGERQKLSALREHWAPGDRWRDMPLSMDRATAAEQLGLDQAARSIIKRDKTYDAKAARHFATSPREVPDPARFSEFAQLLADPDRFDEAAEFARAHAGEVGGSRAIGTLAARALGADPARIAEFALQAVDFDEEGWDDRLILMLSSAFPPAAGSAFGALSADFHHAVRALTAADPEAGLSVAERFAEIYGGLVAPAPGAGARGLVEQLAVMVRESDEVRLPGLQARDAIVSLAGGSYDLTGAQFERSTVLFRLDPTLHPDGPRFAPIDPGQWPETTIAFWFADVEGDDISWNSTLAAAGQMISRLPEVQGKQALQLLRQLIDFSGKVSAELSVTSAVAAAALKFREVANDPEIQDWIEEQGGMDPVIDRAFELDERKVLMEVRKVRQLIEGNASDDEALVSLARVPQLLNRPEIFQALLAREGRDMLLSKLFFLLPASKQSVFLRLLDSSPTQSQTAQLRRLLSWAESSPIPAVGSTDPVPTIAQVDAYVELLEEVASTFHFLFGQPLRAPVLANLLVWRDQLGDDDPAAQALRARIDTIEQAVLHAPCVDSRIALYGQGDMLPALERMGYGQNVDGQWIWEGGEHYLIPTSSASDGVQFFLLVQADAYRSMGSNPGAVDWGQVHVLAAGRPQPGQEQSGPVVRQLGGAERVRLLQEASSDVPVMRAALISGDSEFPGKLFRHLGISPSLRRYLAHGVKGIGVDGIESKETLRQEVDEQMAAEVANWVTEEGRLSDEHLSALRTWATEQGLAGDDRQFAMFLFNLSASVTRLGSESGLGSSGSSVGALRQYGHLLFRQCRDDIQSLLTARPELIQGKSAGDYLNKIDTTFQADSCSDVLSVPMMDLGANINLASYLRTVPLRWMNPNRAEMLHLILAGNEGDRRAADEQQIMSLDSPEVFPADSDAILAQEDANPPDWPSLSRIFGFFDQGMARARQADPDYAGFVIASRRGLADYRAYVNAAGYAPTSQFMHLPRDQWAEAAREQGLTLGVDALAQTETVRRGDGSVAGTRHTPHSFLVERANETQARLELADGHVVNEALLPWTALGEARQIYGDSVRAIKLANSMLPGIENWDGPLPARLDDFRLQRHALLTERASVPMASIRAALPAIIDALRQVEQARAELGQREQLLAGAIELREAQRLGFPADHPRREALGRELELLQAHRGALADSLTKLSFEALVAFENAVRSDLDLLGQLGLLPASPAEAFADEEAVAVVLDEVRPADNMIRA